MFFGFDIKFENNKIPSNDILIEKVYSNTGYYPKTEEDGFVFFDPFKNVELYLIREDNLIKIQSLTDKSYLFEVLIAALFDLSGKAEPEYFPPSWSRMPFNEVRLKVTELGLI